MISSTKKLGIVTFVALALQAGVPDISNLSGCIQDIIESQANPPYGLTFDQYAFDYQQLMNDLAIAAPHLPSVYQQVAATPFISFLQNLGESKYLQVFSQQPMDEQSAAFQQMIPDISLAILAYEGMVQTACDAFEEVVNDLYEGFFSDEDRVSKQTGQPINPPTYGTIAPLVKFGNPMAGPYTLTGDSTNQIFGMGCGVVSLPPNEMTGGLIAWGCLGHETGGHDVTHADPGLLDELANNVSAALMQQFNSQALADYWARCIDETTADVCGYLNMGPSVAMSLVGYFRALGNGKLRTVGSTEDPHPIDLLRGYLGAEVIKRLHFKDAMAWSQVVLKETSQDNGALGLADDQGNVTPFPVPFAIAVQSTGVVADTIMRSTLAALQGHSLQELQDWTEQDQGYVDELVASLNANASLPMDVQGPGFYASYVVAASVTAALQSGSNIPALFNEMINYLSLMHQQDPTWSQIQTAESALCVQKARSAHSAIR